MLANSCMGLTPGVAGPSGRDTAFSESQDGNCICGDGWMSRALSLEHT